MSRINQVMQMGEIGENLHFYIEDYAYTYLKKQKGREKNKYFLYGEKEEDKKCTKLYVYGVAEKPKMEQTYFKEYYPIGFLKLKEEEMNFISLKGQEEPIMGFYVFYASNQAMQEYLVDHREEEAEKKPEQRKRKLGEEDFLPMKEKLVTVKKQKYRKKKGEFKNEKFLLPITGIFAACVILFAMTTVNGRKKIEIFKQVVAETLSGSVIDAAQEEFIIEEKNSSDKAAVMDGSEDTPAGQENQGEENMPENEEIQSQEEAKILTPEQVQEKKEPEEYIVKDGDTLAAICKRKYGSLSKMQEICTMNEIKNADYIAPGQKIYLP